MKRILFLAVFLQTISCIAAPALHRELCFEENAGRFTAHEFSIKYVLKAGALTYYFYDEGYSVIQKNGTGISNRTDFIFAGAFTLEAAGEIPSHIVQYAATGAKAIHGFKTLRYHDAANTQWEFSLSGNTLVKKLSSSADLDASLRYTVKGATPDELPARNGYRFTSAAGEFSETLQPNEGVQVKSVRLLLTGKAAVQYTAQRNPANPSTASSVIVWMTYLGGTDSDELFGVTLSPDSGCVVTGRTLSIDFPVTAGAYQDTTGHNYDAIVAKFDKYGNCSWCTYFGGTNFDGANDIITLDSTFVITGMTSSTDMPVLNATQPTNPGSYNAFLAAFNMSGQLVRSTYFGGTGSVQGLKLTRGTSNEIVLAGAATSTNLPLANSGYQTTMAGMIDAFVALFDSTFTPQWSSYYGGSNVEDVHTITVTPQHEIAFSGATRSFDFPVTADAYQAGLLNQPDIYIVKFSMSGARLYATFFGGTNNEDANGIVGDGDGNLYLTGFTYSADFPTQGTIFQPAILGQNDVFVSRFDSTGQLVWSTFVGGNAQDVAWGIARLGQYIFICGQTESNAFPVSANAIQPARAVSSDGFVIKMDTSGQMISGTFMGGNGVDALVALVVDADTNVTACGTTYSTNLPLLNPYQAINHGAGEGYVVKFGMSEELISTSIFSAEEISTVTAFPNPAEDLLTISAADNHQIASLEIFDAAGRTVQRLDVQQATVSVSIGGLAAGIYFVKALDENSNAQTLRFIKK